MPSDIINKYLVTEGKSNLAPANSYYRVIKPFDIYVLSGHEKSNAYYGSANILRPIFKKFKAVVGDEIHNLYGGLFWVPKGGGQLGGGGYTIHLTKPDFSPFERGGVYDKFDMKKLEQIDKTAAMTADYNKGDKMRKRGGI